MAIKLVEMSPTDRVWAGPEMYEPRTGPGASMAERFAAGFASENSINAWIEDARYAVETEAVEGYDQYADVPDDLEYIPMSAWDGVQSPQEMQGRIAQVRVEAARQDILAEGGWAGFFGQFFGAMGSPEYWPLLLAAPAAMGGTVSGTAIRMGLLTGFEEATHQTILSGSQALHDKDQAMINVGIATILGGAIGAGASKVMMNKFRKEVGDDLTEIATNGGMVDMQRSVNAAANYTYEGERIVNPPWIKWYKMGPMRPLAHSESVESLRTLNNYWEHSYTLGKNLWNEPSQETFETIVERETASMLAASNKAVSGGYKNYLRSINANVTLNARGPIRGRHWKEFQEHVHRAMVNGDVHENEAVQQTARALREAVYNKTLQIAKDADFLDPEDFAVRFAESYAPRRFNKQKIKNESGVFKAYLSERYRHDEQMRRFLEAEGFQKETIDSAVRKMDAFQLKYQNRIKSKQTKIARLENEIKRLKQPAAINRRLAEIRKTQKAIKRAEATLTGSKTLAKLKSQMKEAQDALEGLDIAQFRISSDDVAAMNRIDDYVEDTYQRIVNGYDLDVYMPPERTGKGSAFKMRQLPLEDNDLLDKGWLHSDIESMTMNHINQVVKPSRMKLRAGDTEMTEQLQDIESNFKALIAEARDAGDSAKATKLSDDLVREIDAHKVMRDRWYGRHSVPSDRSDQAVNSFLQAIRNLNTSLMMGMVTLTSAGDIMRWNLATTYAPEIGRASKTLRDAFKTAKLNHRAWRELGIAHETATQIRNARLMDTSGNIETDSIMVNVTGKIAQGLMRGTQLARWTDMNKLMAAAYTQNDLIHKAVNFARLSDTGNAKQQLARMGFDEDLATAIQNEIKRSKGLPEDQQSIVRLRMDEYESSGTVIQWQNWENQEAAEKFANILFRESERAIVSPRTGDLPNVLSTKMTEVERNMLQFMSFAFAAVNQISVPISRRVAMRDPKSAQLIGQMIAGGLLAVYLRKAAQGRLEDLDEYGPMDFALNAVDYSGMVPLMMMGFNTVNIASENQLTNLLGMQTMARNTNKPVSASLGPTVSTLDRAATIGIGLMDGDISESEIRQMRRLTPWNNYMGLSRGFDWAEQKLSEGTP